MGKNIFNISMLYHFSNKTAYEVFLPENNKCIEFRAKRKSQNITGLLAKKSKIIKLLEKKNVK